MQQTPLQTNNFTQADILVDNCLYWKTGRGSAQKEELVRSLSAVWLPCAVVAAALILVGEGVWHLPKEPIWSNYAG